MSLKISHVDFCEIFVEDCNDFTCAQCKDIFNAIKLAEEKFNSALRQPTKQGSEPSEITPIDYPREFTHTEAMNANLAEGY